jgi:hypothetical protein
MKSCMGYAVKKRMFRHCRGGGKGITPIEIRITKTPTPRITIVGAQKENGSS